MFGRFSLSRFFDYFLDIRRSSDLSKNVKAKEEKKLTNNGRELIYVGSVQKLAVPTSKPPSTREYVRKEMFKNR